ncbi:MAG: hypothetical protein R3B84_12500 [Zavarzinella sp.]
MKWLSCSMVLIGFSTQLFGQANSPPERIKEVTLSPNKSSYPALKYELYPSVLKQHPGNAALYLHRASAFLPRHFNPTKEWLADQDRVFDIMGTTVASKDDLKLLKDYLGNISNILRELEFAAECTDADWGLMERAKTDGINLLLQEVQYMRDLANKLRIHARIQVIEGNIPGALKDIRTGFALGRHTGKHGVLIQHLVGIAVTSMFLEELLVVMQHPDCPNLYWALADMPSPFIPISQAFDAERLWIDAAMPKFQDTIEVLLTKQQATDRLDQYWKEFSQTMGTNNEYMKMSPAAARLMQAGMVIVNLDKSKNSLLKKGYDPKILEKMPPAQVVLVHSMLNQRDILDRYFAAAKLPTSEAQLQLRKIDAEVRNTSGDLDLSAIFVRLLLPSLERVSASNGRMVRHIESLRAIEAIRLHIDSTGKIPANLDEVKVVTVPKDPINGKYFDYLPTENRFQLKVTPPDAQPQNAWNGWTYRVNIRK